LKRVPVLRAAVCEGRELVGDERLTREISSRGELALHGCALDRCHLGLVTSFQTFRPFVGLAAVLPTVLTTLSLGDGSVFSALLLKMLQYPRQTTSVRR
jgi:hypothetical protein